MANVKKYESTAIVNATGEITGEQYTGKFTFKTRLSHKERMQIDTLRRQILGPQPEGAVPSPRALSAAQIFANLAVRTLDAPSFWKNSDNGMDLADDDLVSAVYDAAIKAEEDEIQKVRKAGEDAKKDLQADAPTEE